jgi:hypothetical protein
VPEMTRLLSRQVWEATYDQADKLLSAGFTPKPLSRCPNCGKRLGVYVNGNEDWCVKCKSGALYPATKVVLGLLLTDKERFDLDTLERLAASASALLAFEFPHRGPERVFRDTAAYHEAGQELWLRFAECVEDYERLEAGGAMSKVERETVNGRIADLQHSLSEAQVDLEGLEHERNRAIETAQRGIGLIAKAQELLEHGHSERALEVLRDGWRP